MVRALNEAHLAANAPAIVGDYFPGISAKKLAAKTGICSGATPQTHSHFFTSTGQFGSVDQNGNQVDDGSYQIINDHTFRIGPHGTFHYTILNGTRLILHPVITAAERRQALANPLGFYEATWKVAVSYGGRPWKRVSCDTWC